ncbi:MAG: hypothetical protein KatS3mg005_1087 [Bryobacteraceae bacterium]|nr:MAG: hypothetical protein KatS3mg005_1087 [Bryobacteraceae bacterium]
MFFKRPKPRELSFSEHLDNLKSAGYQVQSGPQGTTLVTKNRLGALLKEGPGGRPQIVDTGLVLGNELAVLTDIGFQKIFLAPSGRRTAALAEHLHALHDFREDLVELLGLESLYNEGLGTVNEKHLYDRVAGRDTGAVRQPWQR